VAIDLNFPTLGVFVSIPKCASHSILKMFKLGSNRNKHLNEKSNQFIIYENHQRLKILEKRYDLENKFIFTFARNPYQRIVSWFYYHKKTNPYKNMTLNEWIEDGCKTHWGKQNETDWTKEKLSPLLQFNFIESDLFKVNFIGKIENFEKDCKEIISQLNRRIKENNLKHSLTYEKTWVNKSKKQNEEISKRNKDLIYELFRKDFEYFNYKR